jgi:hypothetical protein
MKPSVKEHIRGCATEWVMTGDSLIPLNPHHNAHVISYMMDNEREEMLNMIPPEYWPSYDPWCQRCAYVLRDVVEAD